MSLSARPTQRSGRFRNAHSKTSDQYVNWLSFALIYGSGHNVGQCRDANCFKRTGVEGELGYVAARVVVVNLHGWGRTIVRCRACGNGIQ